ncbi:MAG: patatin family protein [Eubacterium sp.]|nr:patatin family protein [Eubacterium sp.]
MKKGLVMEGGAMRGVFTCGVVDVFMENGIEFDGAAGISAGAVFGCNVKSRQIGRGVRYNKKYAGDPRYCSVRSLIKTGDLYGVEFCYHTLPEKLDPFDTVAFEMNPMEFYVGATNARTGKPVFHKCTDGKGEDLEWMRASASMPVVSRVVKIRDLELLDGGIACPVLYEYLESLGYDRNVVILTQARGYRKKKSSMLPLIKFAMKKYPAIAKGMGERHLVYNAQMDEIDEMEATGRALVIRPPEPLGIGRTESNPDELERVYQMGRAEALRRLDEVRAYLGYEVES